MLCDRCMKNLYAVHALFVFEMFPNKKLKAIKTSTTKKNTEDLKLFQDPEGLWFSKSALLLTIPVSVLRTESVETFIKNLPSTRTFPRECLHLVYLEQ